MNPLAPDWPCLSPESAPPSTYPRRLIVDELAREIRYRRDAYPKRVEKGWMSADEADAEIGMIAAMRTDFECDLLLETWHASGDEVDWQALQICRAGAAERIAAFGWEALVACLRREIDRRRRKWPELVRKGQLDPEMCRHRIERLEGAHLLYWQFARHFWPDQLGPWHSPDWPCPSLGDWSPDLHERWLAAWRAHRARFAPGLDNQRGDYRQPEAPVEVVAEEQIGLEL